MIDAGADFNLANAKGETPLSRNLANAGVETATADGAIFKLLMDKDVDVTASDGKEHPLVAVSKVRGCAPTHAGHLQGRAGQRASVAPFFDPAGGVARSLLVRAGCRLPLEFASSWTGPGSEGVNLGYQYSMPHCTSTCECLCCPKRWSLQFCLQRHRADS